VNTERLANHIKGLHSTLDRLKRGRDILRSSDFEQGNCKAERAGRCVSLAHLRHTDGAIDIGQNRQPA
jgi:hypothetical protein